MLADLVLVVHFCIAAFITAGFVLIPLGAAVGWRWVRLRRLRLLHAGAIAFVALESLAGMACRHGAEWRVDALQAVTIVPGASDGCRQAATSMPPLVLRAA